MPRAIDLSTIGARFGYAFETVSGQRPSSFTNIPNPKSIPEFNPEPNTGETTSLNNTEYTTYMNLLKDLGGALGFGFGMSKQLLEDWNDMCDDTEDNEASNLATWFTIYHPGLDKAIFFTGIPTPLGMPAMEVNSVWDTTCYITPTNEPVWDTAINPTDPSST